MTWPVEQNGGDFRRLDALGLGEADNVYIGRRIEIGNAAVNAIVLLESVGLATKVKRPTLRPKAIASLVPVVADLRYITPDALPD